MSESNNDLVYRQVIDNKLALKQLQKFESRLISHEKKIQKLKQTTANIEAKQLRASTRKAQTEERKQVNASQKAEIQKQKLAEQTARKNATFEKWKLTQFRSATYAKMKLSDQLKVKEILNSKESHEVIKDNLQKEIALIRRRNMLEQSRAKKQKSVVTGGNVGKNAASGAAGGGVIAGAMANPYVLAGVAAVAGSGMMIKSGSDQFKELQRGATDAGMSMQDFQKEAYVNQALTGFSAEKTAQIYQDVNDKAGDFTSNYEFKDGQVKGGGEFTDVVNKLINSGVVGSDKQSVDALFEGSSKDIVDRFSGLFDKAGFDKKDRSFAFESMASDLYKVQEARRDTGRVKGLEQTFNNSNIAITDQDIANITKFNTAMNGLSATFAAMPLTMFRSFTDALSPSSLETMGKLGEALGKLVSIAGSLLGTALNVLNPALSLFADALNLILDLVKPLADAMADLSNEFNTTFNIIKEMVSNFVQGIIDALPDFLVPDSWKSKNKPDVTTETDSKKDTNPVVTNTTTTPTPDKPIPQPYNMQKPTLPAYNPYGNLGVNNSSSTNNTVNNAPNVTVQTVLDGQVIAQSVVRSSEFESGVNRQMGSGMVGAR